MRAVFSAMRRSFASIAIAFASSKRGARSTSRSVSRTGILASRRLSAALGSSTVMARAPLAKNEEGSRHPVPPLGTRLGPPVRWVPADSRLFRRLLCRSLRHRDHGYVRAAFGLRLELHFSVGQCEQRVIFAYAHVLAGMPFGAALARKDIAGKDRLAAEQFHAEA